MEIDETSPRSAFPNVEFLLQEGGDLTFKFNETVRIFDITDLKYGKIELANGSLLLLEDEEFNLHTHDADMVDFKFQDDSGLIRDVPYVEATVAEWNIVTRKLAVADLTDMDPDQLDRTTGNTDINEFATCLIVGQTSGAVWKSIAAGQKPKPFDDSIDLQEEFNRIKIYDPADASPFGFY